MPQSPEFAFQCVGLKLCNLSDSIRNFFNFQPQKLRNICVKILPILSYCNEDSLRMSKNLQKKLKIFVHKFISLHLNFQKIKNRGKTDICLLPEDRITQN